VAWDWNLLRTPCEGDLPIYAIVYSYSPSIHVL